MNARWLALALAACGGGHTTQSPRERPAVQLVRCAPATPPPLATDTASRTPVRRNFGGGGFGRVARKPTLTFGTPAIASGPISGDEVVLGARGRQLELLACFGAEVRTLARVAVVYRFTINADGSVGAPESTATVSAVIDGCVRRVIRAMKFPAKGGSSSVSLPLVWDSTGGFGLDKPEVPTIEPDTWTPFAIDARVPSAAASGAARATEATMRGKLPAIDKCFGNPGPRGSLRILLELDAGGDLTGVRAGGLGDKDSEWCAAKALAGLHVMTPMQETVEISCDLSRGDAAPWRISPTGGYSVIQADPRSVRHGTDTITPGVSEPEPLPSETYAIVATPDTLGGMLQLALMWARDATGVVLAVSDGKTPPVFLGMGNASPAEEESEALRPALRIGRTTATGCVGRTTHKAELTKAGELAGLMQKLVDRCRTLRCAPTMVVAIDSDAMTKDLLEVSGAARRAGFDRVLFGGAELGCTPEPKRKPDPEFVPEFE